MSMVLLVYNFGVVCGIRFLCVRGLNQQLLVMRERSSVCLIQILIPQYLSGPAYFEADPCGMV